MGHEPGSLYERANRGRYGDEAIDEGQDAIDKHNQRLCAFHTDDDDREDNDMHVSEAELQQCLQEFSDRISDVDSLPAFHRDVSKALDALQDRITAGDMSRWEMQDHVASLQQAVRQTYHDGRSNRKTVAKLAWMVDRLGKALLGLARRQERANPHLPLAHLTKSVTAGLGLGPEGELKAAQLLKSWFGDRGGQVVTYDRELAARLKIAKAISPDEMARWQKYHRLPDDVDITSPKPRIQAEAQRHTSMEVQYALAGMGLSPMVFPGLARRR
jgi:hypothetical protein